MEKYLLCTKCGKKLLKITEKTIFKNEIYCRVCKIAFDADIEGLNVIKMLRKKKEV
ncbi:MAG: hypothetical protein IKP51_08805 [Treponema sp.]|nr:hypothetical protein [Treponema sp.]